VVRFHGEYLNYYSGWDGHTWSTGIAASSDGIHWTKRGKNLSPDAGNGSALVVGDKILYWYQTGSPVQIALDKTIVLKAGPQGSWDEIGVADPYVIQRNGTFYMYYLGMDRARRQRLGVARSQDGVVWEKLISNPIMELGASGAFDEIGLGEPAVWSSGGWYWMLYTGRARGERRRIGLAKSPDGVQWSRQALVIEGSSDWDREVVCDPTVEVLPDGVRVWFGGGDVARPDQGLHGQIGVGMLR
jgi:sucrose-6-phosphate hydrolase SacC (GH32 family)